jgi:catechol 2,3-dioxygenase-like lactoylglutathione lyase family enzyme
MSIYRRRSVSRVQLALNVSDLDAAIEFYSKLFGVEPAKRREGYANFAVIEPPLKLVLVEGNGAPGSLNHLGVEVESTDEVRAATARLANSGLPTATEDEVTCCYAVQDKVWVDAPDGEPWEIYTVLSDAETFDSNPVEDSMCCSSAPESAVRCC